MFPDIRNRCDEEDTSFITRGSRSSSSMLQVLAWKSERQADSPACVSCLLGDLGCCFPFAPASLCSSIVAACLHCKVSDVTTVTHSSLIHMVHK